MLAALLQRLGDAYFVPGAFRAMHSNGISVTYDDFEVFAPQGQHVAPPNFTAIGAGVGVWQGQIQKVWLRGGEWRRLGHIGAEVDRESNRAP